MRAARDSATDRQREQLRGLVDAVLGLRVGSGSPDGRPPTRPPLFRVGQRAGAHAMMWCDPGRSAAGGSASAVSSARLRPGEWRDAAPAAGGD
jgi:hypothetical protein